MEHRVDRALAGRDEPAAIVVSDAVFSVDGGQAPVAELHAAARDHGALLVGRACLRLAVRASLTESDFAAAVCALAAVRDRGELTFTSFNSSTGCAAVSLDS